MIEICLCVHKRKYRLPELMKEFKAQTNQDFTVNIWDNTEGGFLDNRNFSKNRVKILGGGFNQGSQARFKIVPKTSGNPIIFIDDDLSIEPDFVEYYYKKYLEYGQEYILGWFSKRWEVENYHKEKFPIPVDEEADYIGTGGMILDRKIFNVEQSLQNIPEEYAKVEDMYLSYIARMKHNMKLVSIEAKSKIKFDGYDQYKNLREYKQGAFLKLRKEGWELLYDRK